MFRLLLFYSCHFWVTSTLRVPSEMYENWSQNSSNWVWCYSKAGEPFLDLLIHSCTYRHYCQSIPMPTHTMLILLLFVAALIVRYLWCHQYKRSAQVRGTCTNFEREKTCAHRLKDLDNWCSTCSWNATAHPWERTYSSKFRLCLWSLLADFIKDHRRPSGSTGSRLGHATS